MPPSTFRLAPILASRCGTIARTPRPCIVSRWLYSRGFGTIPKQNQEEAIPLRKHLKDEAKLRKASAKGRKPDEGLDTQRAVSAQEEAWELTVGIEIHAELNTAHKLFSSAPASSSTAHADGPNTLVAPFDLALPGTQPQFQPATLLPAIRASLALGCTIQRQSGWDRKHYFHWDQPQGYQITQFYSPLALDGSLTLTAADGVPVSDLGPDGTVEVGIKQVQLEQDTAKTTQGQGETKNIDYNRAGVPLVEIITLPVIHSPELAAAVVRKIQARLRTVDACVTGMELGGLRADVNVSVRRRRGDVAATDGHSYAGVTGLGQRTEIKNLSSFAAISAAIVAERDRQIRVLDKGGKIEGETRGWTLGATETTRLRGKEGEVDYRYMPDPDLPPLLVGANLIEHLRHTVPEMPEQTVARVVEMYGISDKDARTLVDLDDGDRLEFVEETTHLAFEQLSSSAPAKLDLQRAVGRLVGNWVLHELGGLLTTTETTLEQTALLPQELADILVHLHRKQITARAAKQLLTIFHADEATGDERTSVAQLIADENLLLRPLSESEYVAMAQAIISENPDMAAQVRAGGKKGAGKLMWFVGQMVRRGEEGTVEPETARTVLEKEFGL